jgi:hypothetical protein
MKICFIIIYFCFLSCNNNEKQNSLADDGSADKISLGQKAINVSQINNDNEKQITQGVLRIKTDILEQQYDTVYLIHNNDTVNYICGSREITPVFFKSTHIKIRSYYPDYYIIVLDGYDKENNFYKVRYNNTWVLIPHKNGVTIYEDWQTHLKKSFVVTDNSHPLRVLPDKNSDELSGYDYSKLNFICEKVAGDWIYVSCNTDCEGCPTDDVVSGWIKWKDKNQLLVRVYYTC